MEVTQKTLPEPQDTFQKESNAIIKTNKNEKNTKPLDTTNTENGTAISTLIFLQTQSNMDPVPENLNVEKVQKIQYQLQLEQIQIILNKIVIQIIQIQKRELNQELALLERLKDGLVMYGILLKKLILKKCFQKQNIKNIEMQMEIW